MENAQKTWWEVVVWEKDGWVPLDSFFDKEEALELLARARRDEEMKPYPRTEPQQYFDIIGSDDDSAPADPTE